MDVAFLWELLRAIPAGEAAAGHPTRARWDAIKLSSLIADAVESGDSDLADSLRPLYLDYLNKHRSARHELSAAPRAQPGITRTLPTAPASTASCAAAVSSSPNAHHRQPRQRPVGQRRE